MAAAVSGRPVIAASIAVPGQSDPKDREKSTSKPPSSRDLSNYQKITSFPSNSTPFDFEPFLISDLSLDISRDKASVQSDICKFYLKGYCHKGAGCQFKHSRNDKTVVCKHWLRGLCKKGDLCEFLHEYNLKKMPECWFYAKYGECSNPECMYLHVDPESKVKECVWYTRGFCRLGPECRFKHIQKAICQNYITGFCPKGPDCNLGHPKVDEPSHNAVPLMPNFAEMGMQQQQQQQQQNNMNGRQFRPLEDVTCFRVIIFCFFPYSRCILIDTTFH
ncbi:hypothetical protein DFS34DRAFT_575111 [Phlyctochytrium arcticum]|nr:hypothetical protein DFS34DRAFT_575111 [Phlyctochytrium arcticum]